MIKGEIEFSIKNGELVLVNHKEFQIVSMPVESAIELHKFIEDNVSFCKYCHKQLPSYGRCYCQYDD